MVIVKSEGSQRFHQTVKLKTSFAIQHTLTTAYLISSLAAVYIYVYSFYLIAFARVRIKSECFIDVVTSVSFAIEFGRHM